MMMMLAGERWKASSAPVLITAFHQDEQWQLFRAGGGVMVTDDNSSHRTAGFVALGFSGQA